MSQPPTSVTSPPSSPAGADGADPSMEEILASIRRILNEDEPSGGAADASEAPPDDVLVLDRSMLVSIPETDAARQGATDLEADPDPSLTDAGVGEFAASDVTRSDREPSADEPESDEPERGHFSAGSTADWPEMTEPASEPPIAVELPPPLAASPEPSHSAPTPGSQPEPRPMFGDRLVAPETAAATASSVDDLLRTLAASRATQVYRGGPTIEDLVREEIRSLLKVWLDSYLPPLVERLVRTEIERVVGRVVP